MFSMKSRRVLQMTISLAALSVLGACGGGDSSNPDKVAGSPPPTTPAPPTTPPPPTPTPPTPPAPPTTPPTTPPPPVDPGPTADIKLAAGYTDIHNAEAQSTPFWSAWNYTGTDPIDGVACATSEAYHIHSMVSIYRSGVRLALPANIGRNACNYDLHTHDGSGVIHLETATPKFFTLGQFFSVWGQTLNATEVAGVAGVPSFYVVQNEQITKVTTNPDDITLEGHKEIVIVVGTPPTEIPRWNWGASGL
jgi:hypothetical protein